MQIDLDRTQNWLNRTQAIRRIPAVRGGLVRDWRTNRQTVSFVLAGLLCFQMVMLIPRPTPRKPQKSIPAVSAPALTESVVPLSPISPQPLPSIPPAQTLTQSRNTTQFASSGQSWFPQERTDRIAPHAPIWLVDDLMNQTIKGTISQAARAPQLPRTGISVLNR
jgi:hypothetical protein